MIRLQEEWNAVRLPLEEEIRVASTREDDKSKLLARLAEELAAASAKSDKLKEDGIDKDARLESIAKQLETSSSKDEDSSKVSQSFNSPLGVYRILSRPRSFLDGGINVYFLVIYFHLLTWRRIT